MQSVWSTPSLRARIDVTNALGHRDIRVTPQSAQHRLELLNIISAVEARRMTCSEAADELGELLTDIRGALT